MLSIDHALVEWEGVHNQPAVPPRLKALAYVVSACSWRLNLRSGKSSTLTVQRRVNVEAIRRMALKAMSQLDAGQGAFTGQESEAILGGSVKATPDFKGKSVQFSGQGTTPLARAYGFDRQVCEATGKTRTAAAGALRENWETVQGRDWKDITVHDYVAIYNGRANGMRPSSEVAYLTKADWTRYLAIPQGTSFQRADGTPLHSASVAGGGLRIGDMRAMDRCRNPFVKNSKPMGNQAYFNHSSLHRGNGGGVCRSPHVQSGGGTLAYIDHSSGPYQPNRGALHGALDCLAAEGIPMNDVRVGVVVPGPDAPVNYRAATFLANPDSQPDWNPVDNARLNLPADIGAEWPARRYGAGHSIPEGEARATRGGVGSGPPPRAKPGHTSGPPPPAGVPRTWDSPRW